MASRDAYPADAAAGAVLTAANFQKLPGGWIGYVEITTGSATFTTEADVSGLSQAVTVDTNRKIRITFKGLVQSTVAGDLIRIRIKEGATELARGQMEVPAAGGPGQITIATEYISPSAPSAGSHTYKISGERAAGTGSGSIAATTADPAFLFIEDLGTAS